MTDIATQRAKQEEDDRKKAGDRAKEIISEKAKIERGLEIEIEQNEQLRRALEKGNRAYEEESILIDIINKYRAAGIPLIGEEINKKREVAKQINDQRRELERQREATRELEVFADRAFDRIGDAMTRMAVEGKDAWSDWRNLAKGVISEVTQEFMKLALLNPLKNAIFKSNNPTLGDVFGSFFGGGGGGSFGGFFADGGRPRVGVPSIVGEKGPEVFVPDTAGKIVPNSQLGGQTINVYPDMRGASPEAVRELYRMVANLRANIGPIAVGAVTDARQRGLALA
jgi:hypothetical protein